MPDCVENNAKLLCDGETKRKKVFLVKFTRKQVKKQNNPLKQHNVTD